MSPAPLKILRYEDLKAQKGITFHREHIRRLERQDRFPRSLQLSPSPSAERFWVEAEVDDWLRRRMAARVQS